MYLLGVSGGPDSMLLLQKYKNKDIIVAHVNYNLRKSARRDENIVKKYCQEHNIPFYSYQIKISEYNSNFQNNARKIRYLFFKKVYEKYNCSKLILGHHNDDFIETVFMQEESKREPLFWGIKKNNIVYGMNILRPFIYKYWKDDILRLIKIPFGIDETNVDPKYVRNEVRNKILLWQQSKKEKYLEKSIKKNDNNFSKIKSINEAVLKIKKNEYSLKSLRDIKKYHHEILFQILHHKFINLKISSNKIASIWDFINSKEGNKKFIIAQSKYLWKKDQKIMFIE